MTTTADGGHGDLREQVRARYAELAGRAAAGVPAAARTALPVVAEPGCC
jgi:hypothetical protein